MPRSGAVIVCKTYRLTPSPSPAWVNLLETFTSEELTCCIAIGRTDERKAGLEPTRSVIGGEARCSRKFRRHDTSSQVGWEAPEVCCSVLYRWQTAGTKATRRTTHGKENTTLRLTYTCFNFRATTSVLLSVVILVRRRSRFTHFFLVAWLTVEVVSLCIYRLMLTLVLAFKLWRALLCSHWPSTCSKTKQDVSEFNSALSLIHFDPIAIWHFLNGFTPFAPSRLYNSRSLRAASCEDAVANWTWSFLPTAWRCCPDGLFQFILMTFFGRFLLLRPRW